MEAEKIYTIDTNVYQKLRYYVFDGSRLIETEDRPEGDGKEIGPRYLSRQDFWDQLSVKHGINKDGNKLKRQVG